MEKILKNTLEQLGLSEKETKFYLANFHLGPTTITEILRKSRIERSTGYLIAQELLSKGILIEDYKNYRKTIVPVDPRKLLTMLSNKQRKMKRQEIELEENMPQLEAVYKTSSVRPYVQVFEGRNAIISIWDDVLSTHGEILLWTNQATESKFFTKEFHDKFIQERIKKNISIRALVVNNAPGRTLKTTDETSMRQSKLLPIKTSFSAETYIYDHKVAILDYKKDIFGIIVESESIASTQRAIFEMTWSSVK